MKRIQYGIVWMTAASLAACAQAPRPARPASSPDVTSSARSTPAASSQSIARSQAARGPSRTDAKREARELLRRGGYTRGDVERMLELANPRAIGTSLAGITPETAELLLNRVRQVGAPYQQATAISQMGRHHLVAGDLDQARASFHELRSIQPELTNEQYVAALLESSTRTPRIDRSIDPGTGRTREPRRTRDVRQLIDEARRIERRRPRGGRLADQDFQQVKSLYERTIREGNEQQANDARNNLGVLMIKRGDFSTAIREFNTIGWDNLDESYRPVCLNNAGFAYEKAELTDQAYELYKRATVENAAYEPAVANAFRLLEQQPRERRAIDAYELCEAVLRKDAGDARPRIHESLRRYGGDPAGAYLVDTLAKYYAAGTSNPSARYRADRRVLSGIGEQHEVLRLALSQIERVMTAQLNPDDVLNNKEPILDPAIGRNELAGLLRKTADASFYRRDEDRSQEARLRDAMARYLAVWSMDPTNIEAGVSAVNALHKGEFDIDLGQLDGWIEARVARLRGNRPGDANLQLGRLHYLMGLIYAQRANEDESIQHFVQSRDAYARVEQPDGSLGQPAPKLSITLADLYSQRGDADQAAALYVHALHNMDWRYDWITGREAARKSLALVDYLSPVDQKFCERVLQELDEIEASRDGR